IEASLMPWLLEKTMTQVNQLVLGRTILDSIIRDVVNQRIDDYQNLEETLKKVIEGGIDMGTSTGDIGHGLEQNTDRLELGPGELIPTTENNTNDGGETTTSALQYGKLDEVADEPEEEQTNAGEDVPDEQ
ncbi:unnamed protein product, partial [Rotaria sp. Silwood1]